MDDFSVKYVGRHYALHLIKALKTDHKIPGDAYKVEVDQEGDLFCGITFDWHYGTGDPADRLGRYLDIYMETYIPKLLTKFNYAQPTKAQHSPFQAPEKKYGTAAQDPLEPDTTNKIGNRRKLRIQQVMGGLLYYARAVDLTILVALSAIPASRQAQQNKRKKTSDNCSTTSPHIQMQLFDSSHRT